MIYHVCLFLAVMKKHTSLRNAGAYSLQTFTFSYPLPLLTFPTDRSIIAKVNLFHILISRNRCVPCQFIQRSYRHVYYFFSHMDHFQRTVHPGDRRFRRRGVRSDLLVFLPVSGLSAER